MIFSENFLSVEIFLEWKWVFMTCRGRTILRTECLVFCSDGVPCDIQKTLYISLVMSHLIYARPSIVTLFAWIYSLETRRRGTGTTRNRRFKQPIWRGSPIIESLGPCWNKASTNRISENKEAVSSSEALCYFLLDLLLLFHCINGKIGLYISEFVRLSHSETHCGSSGVDLRLTLLAHLANHILSVSALCGTRYPLLSPVASVEQFSKFIWRTYCMFVQSTFYLENICSWRIFPICRSPNVDSACSCWPGHREVAQGPGQNFPRAPMTS
jgi:hypothetical protein